MDKKRILVVEDERIIAEDIKKTLERLGYNVVACPYLHVIHKDLEKMGIKHNPLPPNMGLYPANGWIDSNYKVELYHKKTAKDITEDIEESASKLEEQLFMSK